MQGYCAQAAEETVASVRTVVFNTVPEGDADAEPGKEGEDGAGTKAWVCGGGLGNGDGLDWVRLGLESKPVTRNNHEEVL